MNLDIPAIYRKQPIARRARRLYDQMRKGDNSRVRRLAHIPPARVIREGRNFRLLSLDYGINWKLFNHREYEKELRKWRKKKR